MYSIKFPNMLTNTSTNLVEDLTATKENLFLMLNSVRGTLMGDPYFGTLLKEMIFDQNSSMLQELVIDEIYSCIKTFIPQILLQRENITLVQDKEQVYVYINCFNLLTYQTDLYQIRLISD